MKTFAIIFVLCTVFTVFTGLIFLGITSDEKQYQDWLKFSADHHCHLKARGGWSGPPVWSCDGFEVEHQ